MSKILITGMSASHASDKTNLRSLSFAGVIKLVLEQQGHEVVQVNPEVSWNLKDLEQYDSVLVGLSPITSLSANHVYGALSVIDVLLDSPKLRLFIDAPEPGKITARARLPIWARATRRPTRWTRATATRPCAKWRWTSPKVPTW